MTPAPTYADALAACVVAFGEPSWSHATDARADAWWPAPGAPDDGAMVHGVCLSRGAHGVFLRAGDGNLTTLWTIAQGIGDVYPLPDAIAAAGAWLRGER
ncbi:MAG: hypothetical protein Q8S73_30695 [Deltaproteobacteria bacterium]|nr:hypothetical protein [Myxococcales bacterium]MDP3218511.1 hypothetical protein [Deltaproteobacteria bacterium]